MYPESSPHGLNSTDKCSDSTVISKRLLLNPSLKISEWDPALCTITLLMRPSTSLSQEWKTQESLKEFSLTDRKSRKKLVSWTFTAGRISTSRPTSISTKESSEFKMLMILPRVFTSRWNNPWARMRECPWTTSKSTRSKKTWRSTPQTLSFLLIQGIQRIFWGQTRRWTPQLGLTEIPLKW